jgi:hypothetical protein
VGLSSDKFVEFLNKIQLPAAWALALILNAKNPLDKFVSGLELGFVEYVEEIDNE